MHSTRKTWKHAEGNKWQLWTVFCDEKGILLLWLNFGTVGQIISDPENTSLKDSKLTAWGELLSFTIWIDSIPHMPLRTFSKKIVGNFWSPVLQPRFCIESGGYRFHLIKFEKLVGIADASRKTVRFKLRSRTGFRIMRQNFTSLVLRGCCQGRQNVFNKMKPVQITKRYFPLFIEFLECFCFSIKRIGPYFLNDICQATTC